MAVEPDRTVDRGCNRVLEMFHAALWCTRRGTTRVLALTFACIVIRAQPLAYVANYSSSSVSVIDTAQSAVVATLPVAPQPRGIAVFPALSRAYVLHSPPTGVGSVSVLDTSTRSVVSSIPVGRSPISIVLSPNKRRAYVVHSDRFSPTGSISVLDIANNTVVTTVTVANSPLKVAISPDEQKLYVTHINGTNVISVIETTTFSVTTIELGDAGPFGVALHPTGKWAYVSIASNELLVIDTASNKVVKRISLSPVENRDVVADPTGRLVYVIDYRIAIPGFQSIVDVIDVASNTKTRTLPAGNPSEALAVSSDGTRVYVTSNGGFGQPSSVLVIDSQTGAVLNTISVGEGASAIAIEDGGPLCSQPTIGRVRPVAPYHGQNPNAPGTTMYDGYTFHVELLPAGCSNLGGVPSQDNIVEVLTPIHGQNECPSATRQQGHGHVMANDGTFRWFFEDNLLIKEQLTQASCTQKFNQTLFWLDPVNRNVVRLTSSNVITFTITIDPMLSRLEVTSMNTPAPPTYYVH